MEVPSTLRVIAAAVAPFVIRVFSSPDFERCGISLCPAIFDCAGVAGSLLEKVGAIVGAAVRVLIY